MADDFTSSIDAILKDNQAAKNRGPEALRAAREREAQKHAEFERCRNEIFLPIMKQAAAKLCAAGHRADVKDKDVENRLDEVPAITLYVGDSSVTYRSDARWRTLKIHGSVSDDSSVILNDLPTTRATVEQQLLADLKKIFPDR